MRSVHVTRDGAFSRAQSPRMLKMSRAEMFVRRSQRPGCHLRRSGQAQPVAAGQSQRVTQVQERLSNRYIIQPTMSSWAGHDEEHSLFSILVVDMPSQPWFRNNRMCACKLHNPRPRHWVSTRQDMCSPRTCSASRFLVVCAEISSANLFSHGIRSQSRYMVRCNQNQCPARLV